MLKNVEVITLDQENLAEVLKEFPASFKQAHRLIEYLNKHPKAQTSHVNHACSIGNISDVARKANPLLWRFGIQIGCDHPDFDIFNKFGERSNQYLWSIYRPNINLLKPVIEAANDSDYNQRRAAS